MPELDALEGHSVAAPVGRPRHLDALEPSRHRPLHLLERGAARHGARLTARPRVDAALAGPAREVRIRLLVAGVRDGALDADLPVQRIPVEEQRRPGMSRQSAALAALAVGEEHRTAFVEASQQHDAGRGPAVGVDRREGHGVGVGQVRPLGLLEPESGLGDGIGGGMVEVHGECSRRTVGRRRQVASSGMFGGDGGSIHSPMSNRSSSRGSTSSSDFASSSARRRDRGWSTSPNHSASWPLSSHRPIRPRRQSTKSWCASRPAAQLS